jgi:hypothetical protein
MRSSIVLVASSVLLLVAGCGVTRLAGIAPRSESFERFEVPRAQWDRPTLSRPPTAESFSLRREEIRGR